MDSESTVTESGTCSSDIEIIIGSSVENSRVMGFEDAQCARSIDAFHGLVDNVDYCDDNIAISDNCEQIDMYASDLLSPLKFSGNASVPEQSRVGVRSELPVLSESASAFGGVKPLLLCKKGATTEGKPGRNVVKLSPGGDEMSHVGLDLYAQVKSSGSPNYVGTRVVVPSGLNLDAWNSLLDEYEDASVANYMRYGWPIGAYSQVPATVSKIKNHSDAIRFPLHVDTYISKEVGFGATLGPFSKNPLPGVLHLSPINTVPKKDSHQRRVIVDLSCPEGASVNDAIHKSFHEGEYTNLHYPSTDDLADQVAEAGVGCHVFKRDLSRAYRQIPVCPADYPYLGFFWKGSFYIDRVLPFGLRSAAMICQRVSSAVRYVVGCRGFCIINYLDDFAGAQVPDIAQAAFECLGGVLRELGLQESSEKAHAPSTCMEFLGVEFNTIRFEMRITPERVDEVSKLVELWLKKKCTRRKELESLLGKLHFVSRVVPPGRLFVSRLLEFLRAMPRGKNVAIPKQITKDLAWWKSFLDKFNGISVIADLLWSEPDEVFASDACLTGAGACTDSEYWHSEFPEKLRATQPHINLLELWAVAVCAKLWGHLWKGKRIRILCDNSATVAVVNSGKCRDSDMLSVLRELAYFAAKGEFQVRAVHISGESNRIPDALSRWHLAERHRVIFRELTNRMDMHQVRVPTDAFTLSGGW